MPTIILTRPEGRNASLARAMMDAMGDRADLSLVTLPLLRIDPVTPTAQATLRETLDRLTDEDWVVFVSPRAVAHADHIRPLSSWRVGRVLAVGRATARALEDRKLQPTDLPLGSEDSEGLLAALAAEHTKLPGRRIWIVRGTHGREKLASSLSEAGAQVDFLPVYHRDCADAVVPAEAAVPDAVWVITSPEALRCLLRQNRPKDDGADQQGLLHSRLVVINSRTESIARELGFVGPIVCAGGPDDRMLADGVRRLLSEAR